MIALGSIFLIVGCLAWHLDRNRWGVLGYIAAWAGAALMFSPLVLAALKGVQ